MTGTPDDYLTRDNPLERDDSRDEPEHETDDDILADALRSARITLRAIQRGDHANVSRAIIKIDNTLKQTGRDTI